jgi:para-nitrobenzyl esterase
MTHALPRPSGSPVDVRPSPGLVRGRWEAGVAVFRGIPFAQPPVGALRFGLPLPIPHWDGVREATSFGPPPPQAAAFGMERMAGNADDDGWLTINVWSPDPAPAAGLPTMVWIHGGAYAIGMSSLPEYDGARLARDGGVVVATFNYRVGLEGFGLIDDAPKNRGLLDQIAALEWVRDNIRAFGGDPGRVTVFGESAGGGSVAALLAMPAAVGLFRGAVAQSMQGTFFSPELAADIAAACARELGLRPTATDLSSVPTRRLSAAGDTVAGDMARWADRWGRIGYRSIPFSPVIDAATLPVTPWRALADGAGRDIELLVGHTRHEQRLFTALDGMLGEVTEEQAETALNMLAPGPDGQRRYREGFPNAGPDELFETVNSDWLFRMPTLHLAEAQIAGGGRARVYELTWPAPGMGGILGACHGLDVPLVFGNLDVGQPALLIGEDPRDEAEALSARMRAAWTAFARDGDPGWSAYDTDARLVRLFDTVTTTAPYPEEMSRSIWQDHTFPALPLSIGAAKATGRT